MMMMPAVMISATVMPIVGAVAVVTGLGVGTDDARREDGR